MNKPKGELEIGELGSKVWELKGVWRRLGEGDGQGPKKVYSRRERGKFIITMSCHSPVEDALLNLLNWDYYSLLTLISLFAYPL